MALRDLIDFGLYRKSKVNGLNSKLNKQGVQLKTKRTQLKKKSVELNTTNTQLNKILKKLDSTPFPTLDYLGGWKGQEGTKSYFPLPVLYEAGRNTNELQIIFFALKREIFRNGYDFEPLWLAKCAQCGKEFDYDIDVCSDCGYSTIKPNFSQIKHLKGFLKDCNDQHQTFKEVIEECEDDLQIADEMFLVFVKDYTFNEDGGIVSGDINEIARGSPLLFIPLIDAYGRLGRNDAGEEVFVCPIHRDNLVESSTQVRCGICKKKLYPAHYRMLGQRSGEDEVFYIEGEVIHESKYHPSLDRGYSPIVSVWNKVDALRKMDLYVKDYYGKQRPPKGLLLINTANTDELKKSWEQILKWTEGNPHLIHPMGVQSNSQRGEVAQYINFMNSLSESQYVEVRNEFTQKIGARFGVMPLFSADLSQSGGLNNEGLQVTVTTRAVLFGQEIWNERVFPKLTDQFGIDGFKLVLNSAEEQDEAADVDLNIKKAQHASMMQAMGFSLELQEDGEEFIFSRKPVNPPLRQPSMGGGLGSEFSPSFDDQTFEGEPEMGFSKAKMPSFLSRDLKEQLNEILTDKFKSLDLKRKITEANLKKLVNSTVLSVRKRLESALGFETTKIYKEAIKGVEKEARISIGFGKPDKEALKVIKQKDIFKNVFDEYEEVTKKRMKQAIEKYYAKPSTIDVLVDDLAETIDKSRGKLKVIARTETQHISTIARENSFRKIDPEGKRLYKWINVLDNRTTKTCKELVKATARGVPLKKLKELIKTISKKNGHTPRGLTPHINCRSTFLMMPKEKNNG